MQKETAHSGRNIGIGMAIGLSMGAVLAAATGSFIFIVIGVPIGIPIGLALNDGQRVTPGQRRRLIVALVIGIILLALLSVTYFYVR